MSQTHQTSNRRPPTTKAPAPAAHDGKLIDTMDELLDEIDDVLEQENEFLLRFRQRGGQ